MNTTLPPLRMGAQVDRKVVKNNSKLVLETDNDEKDDPLISNQHDKERT